MNLSINETIGRTVMTSVTTLLALVSLFLLGGDVIRGFVFAMIWGVVGTYSSILLLRLFFFDRSRDWVSPIPRAGAGITIVPETIFGLLPQHEMGWLMLAAH